MHRRPRCGPKDICLMIRNVRSVAGNVPVVGSTVSRFGALITDSSRLLDLSEEMSPSSCIRRTCGFTCCQSGDVRANTSKEASSKCGSGTRIERTSRTLASTLDPAIAMSTRRWLCTTRSKLKRDRMFLHCYLRLSRETS